jgi:hypothetical protein
LTFEGFTVDGNDSVGQKFLDCANAVAGAKDIVIRNIEILDVETIFNVGAAGYPVITVSDSDFDVKGTTGLYWAGGPGLLQLNGVTAIDVGATGGGITGSPECYFVNSQLNMKLGADVAYLIAAGCVFTNIGVNGIVIGNSGAQISGSYFNGSTTRHLDFLSTADRSQVVGCEFAGWSQQAIRTASSAGLRVDGCGGCKIIDTGSGTHKQDGVGIGASTAVAEGVGKANSDVAAVGNITTGEDNLITYSLPANALNKNNAGVRITNWGIVASNANAKTLKVYFGTQVVLTRVFGVGANDLWKVVTEVFRTGSGTQKWISLLTSWSSDLGSPIQRLESGTAAEADDSAIMIKCTGEAVATDDIVQEGQLVENLG